MVAAGACAARCRDGRPVGSHKHVWPRCSVRHASARYHVDDRADWQAPSLSRRTTARRSAGITVSRGRPRHLAVGHGEPLPARPSSRPGHRPSGRCAGLAFVSVWGLWPSADAPLRRSGRGTTPGSYPGGGSSSLPAAIVPRPGSSEAVERRFARRSPVRIRPGARGTLVASRPR